MTTQHASATMRPMPDPTLALLDRLDALAATATPGPWIQGSAKDADQHEVFRAGSAARTACDRYDPDNMILGNYEWEQGGAVRVEDAAYLAALDPATVAALVSVARAASCPMCHGAGGYNKACDYPDHGDSTADHYCSADHIQCAHQSVRAALSALDAVACGQGRRA